MLSSISIEKIVSGCEPGKVGVYKAQLLNGKSVLDCLQTINEKINLTKVSQHLQNHLNGIYDRNDSVFMIVGQECGRKAPLNPSTLRSSAHRFPTPLLTLSVKANAPSTREVSKGTCRQNPIVQCRKDSLACPYLALATLVFPLILSRHGPWAPEAVQPRRTPRCVHPGREQHAQYPEHV